MAKNFGKAGSAKTFESVGKQSAEKAQVITVKMIPNEKLHDYPNNREDVRDTVDLENSIKQLGFIDPIEVTDFGQPQGEYMIVSGHRRRQSGVNVGMTVFPSIVRHFSSESEVENYVLLANSQRDSAKDPLLFCRRYKMHEEYLISIGFKGNIRDEIAKRLGISKSHADRYNTMNKIIFPVWDMVRDEIVGMSSVLPMASHDETEQFEIYEIMQDALKKGFTLTRDTVKQIITDYRESKKTVEETPAVVDSELPLNTFGGDETNTASVLENNVDGDETESLQVEVGEDEQLPGQRTFDDFADKKETSKSAKDISRLLNKLNEALSDEYSFADKDEASEVLESMKNTFENVIEQMYEISITHNIKDLFNVAVENMQSKISDFQ